MGVVADTLCIKAAASIAELRGALALRYTVFGGEGYLDPAAHPYEIEYDPFDLLPQTTHFVAKDGDTVVGTVRLVEDSRFGLPLEQEADFSAVRARLAESPGRRLAEGSRIATRGEYRGQGISDALFKIGIACALHRGITDLISVGNLGKSAPGHAARFDVAHEIFVARLGYTPVGPEFYYTDFHEFALPLHLDLTDLPASLEACLGQPTPRITSPCHRIHS